MHNDLSNDIQLIYKLSYLASPVIINSFELHSFSHSNKSGKTYSFPKLLSSSKY